MATMSKKEKAARKLAAAKGGTPYTGEPRCGRIVEDTICCCGRWHVTGHSQVAITEAPEGLYQSTNPKTGACELVWISNEKEA